MTVFMCILWWFSFFCLDHSNIRNLYQNHKHIMLGIG